MEIAKSDRTQEFYANEDSSIIVVTQSLQLEKFWREYWYIFRSQN